MRVQGSGFSIYNLGFGVWGVGFKVWGSRIRGSGFGGYGKRTTISFLERYSATECSASAHLFPCTPFSRLSWRYTPVWDDRSDFTRVCIPRPVHAWSALLGNRCYHVDRHCVRSGFAHTYSLRLSGVLCVMKTVLTHARQQAVHGWAKLLCHRF